MNELIDWRYWDTQLASFECLYPFDANLCYNSYFRTLNILFFLSKLVLDKYNLSLWLS